MRLLSGLIAALLLLSSCHFSLNRIEGNGQRVTIKNSYGSFDELEVSGDFNVTVAYAATCSTVLEVDENLVKYIVLDKDGDRLKIKIKNNTWLQPKGEINVQVYLPTVSKIELAGSGLVKSNGLQQNDKGMDFVVAGSGELDMEVKTPEAEASIGGSGKIKLQGKTRLLDVNIGGSGDYLGEGLMAEETKVRIGGSGNARVHASKKLDIGIGGSGNVAYSGSPEISQKIAGSGTVRAIQ